MAQLESLEVHSRQDNMLVSENIEDYQNKHLNVTKRGKFSPAFLKFNNLCCLDKDYQPKSFSSCLGAQALLLPAPHRSDLGWREICCHRFVAWLIGAQPKNERRFQRI